MKHDTYPVFEVETNFSEGGRDYIIKLSKRNFNHMCAGYPDIDSLVGRAPNGPEFFIYPNHAGQVSDAFRLMPDQEGYFIYFGAEIAKLPDNWTRDDFDKSAQQTYDNLEQKIRTIGKIPINIQGADKDKELTIGYVTLKFEDNLK